MQTNISLSITEAEYISLSQSMRYYIPLRHIMLEVSSVFGMKCDSCQSYTATFEDNKGAIELAKEPKYRPQTKHISMKWHHFREHIKQGTSKIFYIETNEQQTDIMTKPSAKPQFEYLSKQIMAWWIKSGIMQYLNISKCEFAENVRKEKYVCTIFSVLITLYVKSWLKGFYDLMFSPIIVFLDIRENIFNFCSF